RDWSLSSPPSFCPPFPFAPIWGTYGLPSTIRSMEHLSTRHTMSIEPSAHLLTHQTGPTSFQPGDLAPLRIPPTAQSCTDRHILSSTPPSERKEPSHNTPNGTRQMARWSLFSFRPPF
ncbi:hypothetical protein CLAIMM_05826 isoform 1, partial [Cladophialophora immunda]